MAVLLTGAAGFIGSACAVALRARGVDIVGTDGFSTLLYDRAHKERNLAWAQGQHAFPFVELDIRDESALADLFATHRIDAVVHLAALAGVRTSIEYPERYFDVNVTATARLLSAAMAVGVRRFVVASSSSVYGRNTKTPFAESDPVDHPVSPYAASKRAVELQARTYCEIYGLDITLLRFFTVYGPRQRPDMACYRFMRAISRGDTVQMFGDGTSGRDYTYIDDIVSGVVSSLDRVGGFRIYNLGGDHVVRLRELISAVEGVVGKRAVVEQLPMQRGDVSLTMADLTRSRADLDYAPATQLRAGLEKMWAWYQLEEL